MDAVKSSKKKISSTQKTENCKTNSNLKAFRKWNKCSNINIFMTERERESNRQKSAHRNCSVKKYDR